MADNEKEVEETSSRGTDWEVVSLTASAYAAAPGPDQIVLADETKDKELNRSEQESAQTMFMSGHFVFPPSEHEILPLEHDNSKILLESQVHDVTPVEAEINAPDKNQEDNQNLKGLSEAGELNEIQFFERGKRLNVSGIEFEEGKTTLQGLNLVVEEHGMYDGAGFSPFHSEMGGSISFDGSDDVAEVNDPSHQDIDTASDFPKSPKPVKESKHNGSGLPCQAWWKRQAASLYSHAEGNTFWSICVVAALMGFVILRRRWQQERWQQQVKLQFSMTDEKVKRLFGPVSRFKHVLVGGHQRAPVIRGAASADH